MICSRRYCFKNQLHLLGNKIVRVSINNFVTMLFKDAVKVSKAILSQNL